MSQGSPSKQDRIEKHLARQRGAGVRNLATSFGFSFGFQPASIAEHRDTEEPPAKRRKSVHPHDKVLADKIIAQPEHDVEPQEHRTTRRTATKRKQPRRFEVPSDDDEKIGKSGATGARASAEQDDSFLAAKKSLGKRGRPKRSKLATGDEKLEVEEPLESKDSHVATAKKRGRPKKVAPAIEAIDIAGEAESQPALAQTSTKPVKKRGRPPKVQAIEEPKVAAFTGPDVPEPKHSTVATAATAEHGNLEPAAVVVETLPATDQPQPLAKKRGRPRKAQVEPSRSHAENDSSATNVASVAVAGDPMRSKDACQLLHGPENVAADNARRPRRQAATAAMSKVSEGFFEEEAPIDKKRRDPELETCVKRGRKKVIPPTVLGDAPRSTIEGDVATRASVEDNRRQTSIESVTASTHSLEPAALPLPAVEAKKKPVRRNKARPNVLPDAISNETQDLSDSVPKQKQIPEVTKRAPLSETHANIAMPTPSPEKPSKDNKAASRGHGRKSAGGERTVKTITVAQDTRDLETTVEAPTLSKPRVKKRIEQKTAKESQDSGPALQKPGCYPEAFASGFANADKHVAPQPRTVTDPRPLTGGRVARKATRIAHPTKSSRETTDEPSGPSDPLQLSNGGAASSEDLNKPPHPRKPTAKRDDNHSMDWLFERATTRRPPAAKKNPVAKRRADKEHEAKAGEIDLDDLLSNIASFVPKSMRT